MKLRARKYHVQLLDENASRRQKEISNNLIRALDTSQKYPSNKVQRIREQNRLLPAYQMQDDIISAVTNNQVTLISASTGTKYQSFDDMVPHFYSYVFFLF
jgi:HrpA-like RNA helicase